MTTRNPSSGDGVVWLRHEEERPRRPEPLTRERIAAAAVEELDRHGADTLTMRRLARGLGVTATALYWHIATKEDVLDLALDRIFSQVPLPTATDDLQGDVRALMMGWRAAMLTHPWSPVLIGRPMLGPHVLRRTEFLQMTLARAGLTGVELAAATHMLANFVVGAAMTETTWRRSGDPTMRSQARGHIVDQSDRYPTLAASGHLDEKCWSDDELFRLGLDRILAALVLTRTGVKVADPDPC